MTFFALKGESCYLTGHPHTSENLVSIVYALKLRHPQVLTPGDSTVDVSQVRLSRHVKHNAVSLGRSKTIFLYLRALLILIKESSRNN